MPFKNFEAIKTEQDIVDFFDTQFPDAVPLLGRDTLISTFRTNPVGPLMSVKCTPYNYKGRAVIVGDAAHAMVPFCNFFISTFLFSF